MFWSYGALAILTGAGIWLWWLRRLDRFEPERLRDLLRIGLLGGALAILVALFLGIPLHRMPRAALFYGLAGINEEVAKSWATVLLLKRRDLVDEPVDVVVYALSVALGFALIENLLYFLPGQASIPLLRNLYSLPAHLCFAMIWAVPLVPVFWGDRAKAHPYLWILPFIGVAGLVHGASNTLLTLVKGWPLAAWMAVPLATMVLLGRHVLKHYADQSPFLPLDACPFCGREGDRKRGSRCGLCGSPLARTFYRACASCAGPVPPAARFCQHCGAVQPAGDTHVP